MKLGDLHMKELYMMINENEELVLTFKPSENNQEACFAFKVNAVYSQKIWFTVNIFQLKEINKFIDECLAFQNVEK